MWQSGIESIVCIIIGIALWRNRFFLKRLVKRAVNRIMMRTHRFTFYICGAGLFFYACFLCVAFGYYSASFWLGVISIPFLIMSFVTFLNDRPVLKID